MKKEHLTYCFVKISAIKRLVDYLFFLWILRLCARAQMPDHKPKNLNSNLVRRIHKKRKRKVAKRDYGGINRDGNDEKKGKYRFYGKKRKEQGGKARGGGL